MKKRIIGAILASLLVSGTACADFVVVPPAEAVFPSGNGAMVDSVPVKTEAVEQFPLSDVLPPSPSINQKNDTITLPLSEAMQMVAPEGWKGYSDKELDWTYPVEVNMYADWKQSLVALSNRYNLVFRVDEKLKRLYVEAGEGGLRNNALYETSGPVVEETRTEGAPEGAQ